MVAGPDATRGGLCVSRGSGGGSARGSRLIPGPASIASAPGGTALPSSPLPGAALVLLAVANLGVGLAAWRASTEVHTVYVLTPMVDVVPGGAPLGAVEAEALQKGLRNQVDARDMQRAYARLGSTLSLDDLLRGVEALDAAGVPLDAAQEAELRAVLDGARADHTRIQQVQREILDEEARLKTLVGDVQRGLGVPLGPDGKPLPAAPAPAAPAGAPSPGPVEIPGGPLRPAAPAGAP